MNVETLFCITVLIIAVIWDWHQHRIPNWLTVPCCVLGILYQTGLYGFEGLGFSVLGIGTGLALLIVPFCLRAMGAGDVKLMMAMGAWTGAWVVLNAFVWTAVFGGVIGIYMMYRAGMLQEFILKFSSAMHEYKTTRSISNFNLSSSEHPLILPYGIPIGLGFSTHFFLGGFLS